MKYVIYVGVAVLIAWSAWYLLRQIGRQLKGDCPFGCGGDCAGCPRRRKSDIR